MKLDTFLGMQVVVSEHCVAKPTPGEWAKRFVRHGLADALRLIGEEPGPQPDELVPTAYLLHRGSQLIAHPAVVAQIRSGEWLA